MESTIIGTVLDHFQPNQITQITQIQSGVEKISFGPFWACLGKPMGKSVTTNTVTFFIIIIAHTKPMLAKNSTVYNVGELHSITLYKTSMVTGALSRRVRILASLSARLHVIFLLGVC